MKGPTIRRCVEGRARRTLNPPPRSRVRGTMIVLMAPRASSVICAPFPEIPTIVVLGLRLWRHRSRSERFAEQVFETVTIPTSEVGCGPIGAFEKCHQRRFRVGCLPQNIVGQKEFPELLVEVRSL